MRIAKKSKDQIVCIVIGNNVPPRVPDSPAQFVLPIVLLDTNTGRPTATGIFIGSEEQTPPTIDSARMWGSWEAFFTPHRVDINNVGEMRGELTKIERARQKLVETMGQPSTAADEVIYLARACGATHGYISGTMIAKSDAPGDLTTKTFLLGEAKRVLETALSA